MHWDAQLEDGKGEFVFGRPIRWLLFLYGGRVVPFTIARHALASSPRVQDVTSGAVTYGHRFLATSGRAGRAIKVRSFDEYRKKLAENFVHPLAHRAARPHHARPRSAGAQASAAARCCSSTPQAEALLDEVPDLVEFPAVVAGAFSAEFLTLPEEVLTTTLIHHQHFFPVVGANGALMPAFLAVTNTQTTNERAHRHQRRARRHGAAARRAVLLGRRSAGRARGAARRGSRRVLFHKQLGSYRAKARAHRGAGALDRDRRVRAARTQADAAARAARLAKADLATDMVREFTELQGAMGGIYAREAGEPEAVWKAIYHHYLPIAVEADARAARPPRSAPAAVTWAAVSLADKLDTLVGLFLAGERPTGSRDPFGLRRQAHGILRMLLDAETLTGVDVASVARRCSSSARAPSTATAMPAVGRGLAGARARSSSSGCEYVFEQRGADRAQRAGRRAQTARCRICGRVDLERQPARRCPTFAEIRVVPAAGRRRSSACATSPASCTVAHAADDAACAARRARRSRRNWRCSRDRGAAPGDRRAP